MKRRKYRFGVCAQCGKRLTQYHLDGYWNGIRIKFCSGDCCDQYKEEHQKEEED